MGVGGGGGGAELAGVSSTAAGDCTVASLAHSRLLPTAAQRRRARLLKARSPLVVLDMLPAEDLDELVFRRLPLPPVEERLHRSSGAGAERRSCWRLLLRKAAGDRCARNAVGSNCGAGVGDVANAMMSRTWRGFICRSSSRAGFGLLGSPRGEPPDPAPAAAAVAALLSAGMLCWGGAG